MIVRVGCVRDRASLSASVVDFWSVTSTVTAVAISTVGATLTAVVTSSAIYRGSDGGEAGRGSAR